MGIDDLTPSYGATSKTVNVLSALSGDQTITMGTRPVAGAGTGTVTATGTNFTVSFSGWKQGSASVTEFEAEKPYTAIGTLTANTGYVFAEGATVKLSGAALNESVEGATRSSDGKTLTFTYKYTTPGLPAYSGTADAPTLNTKAGGDVTLNPVTVSGEEVEYGWSHDNDKASAGNWQDGTTFTGLTAGDYYFFARVKAKAGVHSGGGVSNASAKVTVYAAPEITGYGSLASLTIGTAVNVSPTVNVPAGLAATKPYSIDGALPADLSFSQTDGTITGTPTTYNAAGGYVTVKVKDAEGIVSAAYRLDYGPVAKKSQTITAADVIATYGDTDKSVPATATGSVSYAVKDGSEDYISVAADGKLTILKAGEAWVVVTAAATEQCAVATKEVKVTINRKNVTAAMIAEIADQTYTGNTITPEPTITDGTPLAVNTDFAYGYENNVYAGTGAKVTITGQGNYTGTAEKTFTIKAANQTPVITATKSLAKGGNTLDLRTLVTGNQGNVTFEITSGTAATLGAEKYILTSDASNTGDVVLTVNITAKDVNGDGTNDYSAYTGTNAITVTVTNKTTAELAGGVSQTGCTYGETLADPVYTKPAGTTSTTITYNGTLRRDSSTYSSTTKPTEAGTYTVTVKCETATHIYQATSDSFTIAPKSIEGAVVTLGTALTYDGSSQTQTVTKVELGSTDITASCDVSNNAQTNAGSYQLTVTAKAASNYAGSVSKDFTIAKKSITPTVEVSGTYTYTGSAITPTYTVKDSGTELTATDFNAVVTDNINAGSGKITVTEKATGNYTFSETQQTFTIGKATYGDQTTTGSAKYGATGSVDLSSYLKDGYVIGTITKTNASIFESDPSMDETSLKFTFTNVSGNAGQTAEITVPVTSATNYDTYSIKVTVTVNAKTIPTVTAPTAVSSLTYDGTAQALISAGATNGGEMQYSLTSGSGYSTAIPTATNANTYTVYYKVVGNDDYADVAESSVSVTIAKKDVTIAPKSFTITKGSAIPTFELVYTGLVGSDTLTPSATPDFTCYETGTTPVSTTTAAGTYTITWTNESTTSFTGADNYNVTKTATGTLTINNPAPSGGGGGGGVAPDWENPYTDVAEGAWYYDSVKYVTEKGLMNGTGDGTTFSPLMTTTRGMVMTMLARMSGTNTTGGSVWYEKGQEWAVANGISDGTNPGGTITRQEFAVMLYRYAQLKGYSVSGRSDLSSFPDSDKTAAWAQEAMEWAVKIGIIGGGDGGLLNPTSSATRAEVAKMLMSFCEKVAK